MDDTTLRVRVGRGVLAQVILHRHHGPLLTTCFPTLEIRKTRSFVSINNQPVDGECVSPTKLFGVVKNDRLPWTENNNYIYTKPSKRLYLPRNVRRDGIDSLDLLVSYTAVIRPDIEYANPVWHNSMTAVVSANLESIQLKIIEPHLTNELTCAKHNRIES